MRTVIALASHSIWDIALQEYGDHETAGVQWIIEDNENILEVDDIEGMEINVRDEVIDKRVKDFFDNRSTKLVS